MLPVSRFYVFLLLTFGLVLAGCGHSASLSSNNLSAGSSTVVLAITDAPPVNVTILSAQVTLTGATLNPGNVALLAGPATLELTRLQTDIAYLSTTTVNAGTYTSLALTFSNPKLTIENDTGGAIAGATCVGTICTIAPVSSNLSTTITIPAIAIAANKPAGLLVDVNLGNLLSSTLGADFVAGTSVSEFTPAGTGAPAVGAEDLVGQVTSVDSVHSSISLQTSSGLYPLTVDNTATFFQFPSNLCATPGFSCLQSGQILSVDIGLRADGTPVARNIVFEDANASETEVQGIVTSINVLAQSFTMVTLSESAPVSSISIGDPVTVQYTLLTSFDRDTAHADNTAVDTTGFLFSLPADLFPGQQVQVRRTASSSGTVINADRVRLRSSRITGLIQSLPAPFINIGGTSPNFPSFFITRGVTQIQAKTFPQTIFTGMTSQGVNITSFTQLAVANSVSVRGPLFANAGSPTVVATKVAQH